MEVSSVCARIGVTWSSTVSSGVDAVLSGSIAGLFVTTGRGRRRFGEKTALTELTTQ